MPAIGQHFLKKVPKVPSAVAKAMADEKVIRFCMAFRALAFLPGR